MTGIADLTMANGEPRLCNREPYTLQLEKPPIACPAQPKIIKNKHKIKASLTKIKNSSGLLDSICEDLRVPQSLDYTLTTRAVDKHITTIPPHPSCLDKGALLIIETP